MPLAGELAKYDQVVPGAAERIIAMVEQQAAHGQRIENKVIDSDQGFSFFLDFDFFVISYLRKRIWTQMNTDKHGFQAPDYIWENLYPQKHFLEGKDRAGRHYIDQGPTNVSK